MKYNIVKPSTKSEFDDYYFLRWKILRKPLGLDINSVKDSLEDNSFHLMITNQLDKISSNDMIKLFKKTVEGLAKTRGRITSIFAGFNGKTILEMGDLYSDNYFQSYKYLNFFNPLKYIYFIEKKLLESYEKRIINYFDCNILVSPNDLKVFKIENTLKKKIKIIGNGTELKKRVYKFKKSNKDIIFIGNINYLLLYFHLWCWILLLFL